MRARGWMQRFEKRGAGLTAGDPLPNIRPRLAVMAAQRGPRDFGGTLRAARERRGLSLRQIATATKISMLTLEALERNDLARLPGGIFSRAFVRAYALEVG